MNKKELNDLMLADLMRSGIMQQDIKKMKLQAFDKTEASKILNSEFATSGYLLPYFDVKGKLTGQFRFRFLEDLLGKDKKPVKYSQPKGSINSAYFAPCTNWVKVVKDIKNRVVITEGEKKAYAACKAGIITIGLGGVWSFKNKRLGKDLIDELKQFDWKGRTVEICFDSDQQSNPDVLKAARALAKVLNGYQAIVINRKLPYNPYNKIGLDDYLLTHTVEDYEQLETETFYELDELSELNDDIAYIRDVGKVFSIRDNLFISDSTLTNVTYANKLVWEGEKEISVAKIWLKWRQRREHTALTYAPGQDRITTKNELNLWHGWGTRPVKGNVNLFIDAVAKLFDHDETLVKWFLDWVAYPVQYPGTKMLSAVLLQSIAQGTGKSSIGLCIGAMYGANFQIIDDAQLHNPFNEWAVNRQFILGDEISGKDKKTDSDRIKNLITRPEITINKKFAPTYIVPDCINYLFTSNHPDPLNLEPDDRRVFVIGIKEGSGLTLSQGRALEAFRKGNGTAALLHYFAFEHQIEKHFDHRARPPMTDAKAEIIDHSLTDVERWLVNLRNNPDHFLKIGEAPIDRDVFTVEQIVALYQRQYPRAVMTNTAMGKALNKIFPNSGLGMVRTSTNGTVRLRAIRNIERWIKMDSEKVKEHYESSKIHVLKTKQSKVEGG